MSVNHEAFEIIPVTRDNNRIFYQLIQEQAAVHGEAEKGAEDAALCEALFRDATETRRYGAFLVYDHQVAMPVTAVTYYDCWTPYGPGLYLEDVVTTRSQRRRGHGAFALAALAQMAVQRGFDCIRWECAAHNATAQKFYDDLGSVRLAERQTWRSEDPVDGCRDAKALCLNPVVQEDNEAVAASAAFDAFGRTLAVGHFYRSYSTFRACPGLHVEALEVEGNHPDLARSYLCGLWARYGAEWNGHFDVTVSAEQRPWLAPALERLRFTPLSYGDDVMVARVLSGEALSRLADRPGRNIVQNLCSRPGTCPAVSMMQEVTP